MKDNKFAIVIVLSISLISLTAGCTDEDRKNAASGDFTIAMTNEGKSMDESDIKQDSNADVTISEDGHDAEKVQKEDLVQEPAGKTQNDVPLQEAVEKPQEIHLPQAVLEKIDKKLDELVTDKKFKGCVLVAHKGEVLVEKAFGMADIENGLPNTIDTRFMIASMTKQFTAACILMLKDKGALSVEDTVDKFIAGFPSGDKVTIHQLLTHTSGLNLILPGSRDDDYIRSYPGTTIKEKVVNGIKNKDIRIAFPPIGSKFNYSDVNYLVLSLIIEEASGLSYEAFLKENIFDPLGMKNSGTGYDPANNAMLATGYGPERAMLVPGLTCADMCGGAGSIYSTVGDMYKWDRALRAGGIISEASLKAMFTPYDDTYGYGWWFFDTGSGDIPEHGGRLLNGTFSGFFVRDTINDSTVIVLGNDGNHDDKRDFAEEVCIMLAE